LEGGRVVKPPTEKTICTGPPEDNPSPMIVAIGKARWARNLGCISAGNFEFRARTYFDHIVRVAPRTKYAPITNYPTRLSFRLDLGVKLASQVIQSPLLIENSVK